MSNKKILTKEDYALAGWGLAIVLAAIAWFVSLVLQFFGAEWYWPWLFFGILVGVVARVIGTAKDRKVIEEIDRVLKEIPKEEWPDRPVKHFYIPQSREHSCWVQIPLYRDYEIHCETHEVRNRHTLDKVEPGRDPEGKNYLKYVDLGCKDGRIQYVRLDWVIENALKRKV